MRLFHGTDGELKPGMVLLPASVTGISRYMRVYEQYGCNGLEQYRSDFVWLATDILFAQSWGKDVWEVETVGGVWQPDNVWEPEDIIYDCDDVVETRLERWGKSHWCERIAHRAIAIRKVA